MRKKKGKPRPPRDESPPPAELQADLNDSPLEAMPAAARLALLAWAHNDQVKAHAVALVLINEENGATLDQVAALVKRPRKTIDDWVTAWKRDRKRLLKTLMELQGNVDRLKTAEALHGERNSSEAPSSRDASASARPRSSRT